MASMSTGKHGRDSATDFQGFLNDLQDWELSLKDKKHVKQRQKNPSHYGFGEEDNSNFMVPSSLFSKSSSFGSNDAHVDASSEKELGNEHFKKKQYNEAIECYSRSIALSPTAAAYANRAMAYIKVKRYREAEVDSTEALNLDDRYIKAYSRRSTCRKELGKLKEAVEDAEFALKLEPNNLDLKKQYGEYKTLHQKDVLERASLSLKKTPTKPKVSFEDNVKEVEISAPSNKKHSDNKPSAIVELVDRKPKAELASKVSGAANSSSNMPQNSRHKLQASIEELASQAASLALTEASKNIKPPTSAYQFEITWRGFSGDRELQTRLLKVVDPSSLPQIFKNALSGSMLLDIVKCVATFFQEEPDLGVKYLEYLTKVPRFDMLLMCLSSKDIADFHVIWDSVFCKETRSNENGEAVDHLRLKYFPR